MYYPKSQITTNLYTTGGEFYIESTQQEYKGFYFKTSNGAYFSGKTPDDRPNQQLSLIDDSYWNQTAATEGGKNFIQLADNIDGYAFENQPQNPRSVSTYSNLTKSSPSAFLPYYQPELPTQEDYSIGEFRRYFCKKTNELRYTEIDKTQYDLIVTQDDSIVWQLYIPFYLNWELTGDKEQVARTNKNITELTSQRKKLFRLGDYLKNNYIKYYK